MALRKIAVMGNPVLRKPAEPVKESEITSPKIQALIQDMIETMFEYDGLGLAAPQIHESLQIVVMLWNFDPKEKPSLLCLINPKIKQLTETKSSHWEGCLSVPGLRGFVSRPNKVSIEALGPNKEKIKFEAEGFAATVIQHECDHLLGKLYIDRMDDMTKLSFNKEFSRFLASDDDEESEGDNE